MLDWSWQHYMGCNFTVWFNAGALSRFRERLQGFNPRTSLIVPFCGLVATQKNKHPISLCFLGWHRLCADLPLFSWLSAATRTHRCEIPPETNRNSMFTSLSSARSSLCPCLTLWHDIVGWLLVKKLQQEINFLNEIPSMLSWALTKVAPVCNICRALQTLALNTKSSHVANKWHKQD